MGFGRVEPAGSVIIAQPFRDEDRVICRAVRLGQHAVHGVRSLAHVVVIDALDTDEAGIFRFRAQDVLIGKCQPSTKTGVRSRHTVHMLIEMELHGVAAALQIGGKLAQPLIAAAVRTSTRNHVECNRGDRLSLVKEPIHLLSGKNVSTGNVASGPRM